MTHSSHHVKAINRKTLKTKYKPEKATFIANISYNLFPFWLTMGMILLETVFADISITFSTDF